MKASIPIPDGGEIGLPIAVPVNAIALNGSAPPRVTAITSTISDGLYGTGQVIPIYVTFTSAVVVTGKPSLVLGTGCFLDSCSVKEIQAFTCQADAGAFSISFAGSSVVNVPALANQDQLKYALEGLDYIEEVTVAYGDSDDREYSRGPRACTSVGNVITITFERTSYIGTDGDLPMLTADWLNAPLDLRTYYSAGDGSFLMGRFPATAVGVSPVQEVQKGHKMDNAKARYVSGSGSKSLLYMYTVNTGDYTTALDVIAFGDPTEGLVLSNWTLEAVQDYLPYAGQNISLLYASAKSLSFDQSIEI